MQYIHKTAGGAISQIKNILTKPKVPDEALLKDKQINAYVE